MWQKPIVGLVIGVAITPLVKPLLRASIKRGIIITDQARQLACEVRDEFQDLASEVREELQDVAAETAVGIVRQSQPASGDAPAAN